MPSTPGLDHVVGGVHREPLQLERRPDQLTQEPVVVDHEYATRAAHAVPPIE
jgi:hypothetical protein